MKGLARTDGCSEHGGVSAEVKAAVVAGRPPPVHRKRGKRNAGPLSRKGPQNGAVEWVPSGETGREIEVF